MLFVSKMNPLRPVSSEIITDKFTGKAAAEVLLLNEEKVGAEESVVVKLNGVAQLVVFQLPLVSFA